MGRTRLFLSSYGLDALVVLTAAWSATSTALRDDLEPASDLVRTLEVVAIAAVVLLLVLRRRLPFAAPVAIWVGSAALSFVDGRLITGQAGLFLAGLGGAILLGGLRSDVRARLGFLIVLAGAATIVVNDPTHVSGDPIFTPVLFGVGWLIGYALRERAAQTEAAQERAARAERDRESAARLAVAEERGRIARELHDVVAHAVSVMVLQVGAVRHGMPESQVEHREALANVERAGRTALTEMRRLLGAMRHDDEHPELAPQPGLASLEGLLADVRVAGLPVALEIHGEPVELPPGLDLSAYRVVQEALTNALRHAQAHQAEVQVSYESIDLRVEIRDDGQGPAAGNGSGHGLVGIAERVKIYGGEMSAGGSPGGGFRVCARFPLERGGR